MNIAVFIDFDNIEIGVKTTLGQQFDIGAILDAIKERGEVVTKIAYADWTRAGEHSRMLTQHAIRLVQRNLTPGGDKNGADINLALDALEMAFTHQHINAYVIVGGDSDFLSLVEKLKQYDKKVFVVGGRAFTSVILQRNCHEFIAYENLSGVRKQAVKSGRPMPVSASLPIAQAVPVVRRALKILADREVSPQTGLLKSTLLQLDSTFSERTYGASSFLDFVEKLSQAGLVQLKHAGRSVMVELVEGAEVVDLKIGVTSEAEGAEPSPIPAQESVGETIAAPAPGGSSVGELRPTDAGSETFRTAEQPLPFAAQPIAASAVVPVEATESQADGVIRVGEILKAATNARWPMYLRNVKQLLRAADGGFDERRYGFAGLVELVRGCQKDGLVRLERDRRGGLRVFPGPTLQRVAPTRQESQEASESQIDARAHSQAHMLEPGRKSGHEIDRGFQPRPFETAPSDKVEASESIDVDIIDTEPMPTVDPTAELLGTASRRRRPARATTLTTARGGPAAAKKPAAKKPAAPRRSARAKTTSNS
ncbi:MAG: NYN domain-containing protein [Acidobacteriota bacterium]